MTNQRQKQDYEAMEPSKKRILLEKKQVRDMTNKHELKMKQLQKYKTMDTAKKQDLLNKKAEQLKTMDTAKKQDLLNKKAEQYLFGGGGRGRNSTVAFLILTLATF